MTRSAGAALVFLVVAAVGTVHPQPASVDGGVRFTYHDSSARSVSVVGDFNAWSKEDNPLAKSTDGLWSTVIVLRPGRYQYKFVVDGTRYELDPRNPAAVDNYNGSSKNSVFVLSKDRSIRLSIEIPNMEANVRDVYPAVAGKKPVYLNIIWHQHQPLYANPETDQLTGPWVRTHATKDYYDMAAILKNYPEVHCTFNLTASLLLQIQQYYVARLKPFVNTKTNTLNVQAFLKKWKGKTDPWIDLALKPSEEFDSRDRDFLFRNAWNAFGVNEVMMERFPEYRALQKRLPVEGPLSDSIFSVQELREIKFWFYLAHFDPDFLNGPVTLEDGSLCDLSGYVEHRSDGTYRLKTCIGESDCRRMVVEAYKVMANVIPIHRRLQYLPRERKGQIDIITTPYYHPILPLIYDSDLARVCQPRDSLPHRFSYPQDARAQVVKAVQLYKKLFGRAPAGMWPGEGALAQPVLEILRKNGIVWSATDVKNLRRSDPQDQPNTTPYSFPAGRDRIALVFRDTELSDRIGFKYQAFEGEIAAEDFVQSILAFAPTEGSPDVLITVILDGENAWEWYRKDVDGKEFLHALYRKLTKLYRTRRIVTTTMSEYLSGNPARSIDPHPVAELPSMHTLWPGSWINANFDTWIGEPEENAAWEYLLKARTDLGASGLQPPDPDARPPREGTKAWFAFKGWEEMYAAEGSDWFWWYGADQQALGGDEPFDVGFRTHLTNVYTYARRAGGRMPETSFAPIIIPGSQQGSKGPGLSGAGGTMVMGTGEKRTVLFTCDAGAHSVPRSIFITGSVPELASWTPNQIALRNDGHEGDERAGDAIWSLRLELPSGVELHYKYTNSGEPGKWDPGDELPGRDRVLRISPGAAPLVVRDVFGKVQ